MKIIDDIPVWGAPVDAGALTQIQKCSWIFKRTALMADHHKGYGVPIGGVVADPNLISPTAVGYDIACGNKAVLTDATLRDVQPSIAKIMDDIWAQVSFGIGRKNAEPVDHPLFEDDPAWYISHGANSVAWHLSGLKQLARDQLGTVGSGNHFVDVFADEQERIWVGVHFGSRGLGHKIATHFLQRLGAKDDMDGTPAVIDWRTDEGGQYVMAMNLAGRYAYAGRDWVCAKVLRILGAKALDEVHNHHNFAWRETHNGEDLWVMRKGATPAFPGQRGFIGATMGEQSVIVEGLENDSAGQSLYSTVHGAGRVMGRMEAKGKRDKATGEWKREPKVTEEMLHGWVGNARVTLRGGGVDESPHCYKRLSEVMAEHEGMIRVLHTLTPLGVAMAGANEFDPFRD